MRSGSWTNNELAQSWVHEDATHSGIEQLFANGNGIYAPRYAFGMTRYSWPGSIYLDSAEIGSIAADWLMVRRSQTETLAVNDALQVGHHATMRDASVARSLTVGESIGGVGWTNALASMTITNDRAYVNQQDGVAMTAHVARADINATGYVYAVSVAETADVARAAAMTNGLDVALRPIVLTNNHANAALSGTTTTAALRASGNVTVGGSYGVTTAGTVLGIKFQNPANYTTDLGDSGLGAVNNSLVRAGNYAYSLGTTTNQWWAVLQVGGATYTLNGTGNTVDLIRVVCKFSGAGILQTNVIHAVDQNGNSLYRVDTGGTAFGPGQ
jgi:hypothetical protein